MKSNTGVAGVDIGKSMLDYAVYGETRGARVANTSAGWAELVQRFAERGVGKVGLEASGGYEQGLVGHLRSAGIEVIVLQPMQVRAFARAQGRRAKNDRLDAALIAAFTAIAGARARTDDPRLAKCRDILVFLEQIEDDIVRFKTRAEHIGDPRLKRLNAAEIRRAEKRRADELKRIVAMLTALDDQKARLDLLISIPGIGERTAVALLIAMPELGSLSREEVASLAGLAPFDHDSGQHHGERHIAGGRTRVRSAIYKAAVPAATQWNPLLKAFYKRLIQAGKKPRQAFVACARKLLVIANAVIQRGTPWQNQQTP